MNVPMRIDHANDSDDELDDMLLSLGSELDELDTVSWSPGAEEIDDAPSARFRRSQVPAPPANTPHTASAEAKIADLPSHGAWILASAMAFFVSTPS